ncbi:MAG TPA: hypothetical protein VHY32_03450 [Caulobacteraceae bacterium]|jgi:hypothetical protein|nr:hypothetical protein [Caulobacteraceae bacterium]
MAELEFEARLDRLFAQAPVFPDAAIFAIEVDHRLERGWTLRRLLIGGLGLLGGLFGVVQLVSLNVLSRAETLTAQSSKLLSQNVHQFIPLHLSFLDLPFGREILGMSAALAVIALVLGLTRAIEEI